MKELVYALAMFTFVVSMLTFVLGVIHPSLFKFRLLGVKLNRRYIALYSFGLLLISSVIASTFEPARVKQARTDRGDNAETSEQAETTDKLNSHAELKAHKADPDKNDRIDLEKSPKVNVQGVQDTAPRPAPINTPQPAAGAAWQHNKYKHGCKDSGRRIKCDLCICR